MRVVDLDTSITVEAGTFTAAHYAQLGEVNGEPWQCGFFVAPGVGVVKKILPWVDRETGSMIRVEVDELVAYHLAE